MLYISRLLGFETTASAVSNTVGLEPSFSTTLSLQRIGALKCMYFDNTCIYKVIYHTCIIVINGPPSLKYFWGESLHTCVYVYIYIL